MEEMAQPPASPPAPVRGPAVQRALAALLAGGLVYLGVNAWLRGNLAEKTAASSDTQPARLDLNQAGRPELELLPGVGPGMAQRIEAYRILYGPFPNVDELRKVPGLGPQLLERIRPHVMVANALAVEERRQVRIAHSHEPAPAKSATALIDLNNASANELQALPGIGVKLAQRIIEARAIEPFRSVDDLRRVKGIGPKTLEKVRPLVTP